MRLPRDVSGQRLADALGRLGYASTRQRGEHHVSIPLHDSLRIGTLAGILSDVAGHHGITRDELLLQLGL